MTKRFPRISTRGDYDLHTAKTLQNSYRIYPRKSLDGASEIAVMIHGLRNNPRDALEKFRLAESRLRILGYKHHVAGFSYDSNTSGAHLKKSESVALKIGQKIAKKNGRLLAKFVLDMKGAGVRLLGHSLGAEVIESALDYLAGRGMIKSAHMFGASLSLDAFESDVTKGIIDSTLKEGLTIHYSTDDEVLRYAEERGYLKRPLGLHGYSGDATSKIRQFSVHPENHRFASYVKTLEAFP